MKKNLAKRKNEEVFFEISSLKEDLEDLKFYLEEFSAFLPLPVISVNPLGFILDTNDAFKKLIGREKINILGESIESFFREKEKFRNFQNKVLAGKTVREKELTLISEKKEIPVSVFLSPRKDKEGNIIGYFVGIYDIRTFKELQATLEEKVQERTKQLQERIRELELFHRLTVERELKMVELKKKIKELEKKIKEKEREINNLREKYKEKIKS